MTTQIFDATIKGRYVTITDGGTTARRHIGFSDGVVLSANYVRPGELVAVEILETQPGWSGDLRVGFTLLPDHALQPLPSFTLPELVSRGQSWIVPVGIAATMLVSHRHRTYWRRQQQLRRSSRRMEGTTSPEEVSGTTGTKMPSPCTVLSQLPNYQPFCLAEPNSHSPCSCCLHTAFGRVAFSRLMPLETPGLRAPGVEKSSIVAIYYEIKPITPLHVSSSNLMPFEWPVDRFLTDSGIDATTDDSQRTSTSHTNQSFQLQFHLVINGVDLITLTEQLPIDVDQFVCTEPFNCFFHSEQKDFRISSECFPKLKAVFDVYGQTKAVQFVRLHQNLVAPLSRLCSCAILTRLLHLHYYDVEYRLSSPGQPNKSTTTTQMSNEIFGEQSSLRFSPLASQLTANTRMQHLFSALRNLPLPRSDRQRLQVDAFGVVARELEGLPSPR